MSVELKYRPVMWAEMKPDVYGGKKLDKHIPMWESWADGDMESGTEKVVSLAAKHFPPGTKIVISEPECPKCHQVPEMCKHSECDFDWKVWTENEYS